MGGRKDGGEGSPKKTRYEENCLLRGLFYRRKKAISLKILSKINVINSGKRMEGGQRVNWRALA